jgi:uncharacterized protein YkwD
MKTIFFLMILLVIVSLPASFARAESPASVLAEQARVVTDAYSMIAEVNALRAANGLPAYTANSILMSIAQQHAEFMSVNGVAHTGYGGTRPYQRALNAGYPLAGDLSLGGFISENITAGNNKSVQQAVTEWQGDAPHLNTMLSPNLQEIGAGVAYVGDYVYYVIDCARPTGSGQPQYTPVPGQTQNVVGPPLARTVIPNTPNADGKLYHIVGSGETLWLIAVSYGVKIADIRRLNNMTETEAIFPKEKLLIRDNFKPGPASGTPGAADTPTATSPPTFTLVPTWTPLPSLTPIPPTPIPVAPISSGESIWALVAIITAALVLAGIFVRAGRKT